MSTDFVGFIYLWMNRENGKFYLGSHKGFPSDGYICSSKTMLISYNRNPQKFKRRVVEYVVGTLKDLHNREQLWLNLIKEEELGRKYYNQKKLARGGNGAANKGKKKTYSWNKGTSKEYREEYSNARKLGLFCLFSEKPKETKKMKVSIDKNLYKDNRVVYRTKRANGKTILPDSEKNKEVVPKITVENKEVVPKRKYKQSAKIEKKCPKCDVTFLTSPSRNRIYCSKSCACSENAKKVKINGMKGAEAREKIRIIATGRKKTLRPDGSWYWKKDAGVSVSKEPAPSFTD